MLKILHFIFGQLYFQVKGYQTERFLNLCAKNHLVLWELKPVSDGYVFFIRRSSYQMLEALAEKANLHRTYISDIERGQRNVSLENIYNIAVALEIEPYMLLQKTDERNEV